MNTTYVEYNMPTSVRLSFTKKIYANLMGNYKNLRIKSLRDNIVTGKQYCESNSARLELNLQWESSKIGGDCDVNTEVIYKIAKGL